MLALLQALIKALFGGSQKAAQAPVAPPPATTPAPAPKPVQAQPVAPQAPTAEQLAAKLAEPFEGFRSAPYQDSVGVWTIGYGSTYVDGTSPEHVTSSTPAIDEPTAARWLANEMWSCCETINRDVKVPLTVNEKAALEDWIYNLGSGNFAKSQLLTKLNAGDYAGAAAQIDLWDEAGGHVLAGLLRRRQAETALFKS